ncbi:hypothetical protein GQ457_15G019300 [Hibiscus cannabinus]
MPRWSGVSERRSRTLLDMVRSMMSHNDLPTSFWGHALETVAFALNRVSSKSVQKISHEMWIGKRPNMSFKKGYYFYNPKEKKVFVARTRDFLEKEFLLNKGKGRNIELEEVQQQQVHEPEVEKTPQVVEENSTDLETQPVRRSTRERHEPERYGFLVTAHGDVILVDQDESKTYQEAVSSPDSEKWLETMRSEMDSMSDNQVWTLVEPPEGIKPIGCKWVFKKKTDMDGNVQTYKGRLVAKVAFHDYEIWQMTQPEGFVTLENTGKEMTYLPLQSIKTWLSSCFSMKDLGETAYILAVKIYRDRSRRLLVLSQSTYIDKGLKRFSMEESKRGFLPMRHGITLSKEMCPSKERMSQIPYASAIGPIMYAMICTRPDLSYALSMTSRYQENPGEGHWTAVMNILKYLRRTKDVFLVYGGSLEQCVYNRLHDLGWFRLARQPARANYNWVIVFYTSNSAGEDHATVHGRRVPANAATINAILGLPDNDPSFYAKLGAFVEDDFEQIKDYLCEEGMINQAEQGSSDILVVISCTEATWSIKTQNRSR